MSLDMQKGSDSTTSMVGEDVTVGCVAVRVTVTVDVEVGDDDAVLVALGVSVKGSKVRVAVANEEGSGVGSGVSGRGPKINASRITITTIAGMTYSDQTGRD